MYKQKDQPSKKATLTHSKNQAWKEIVAKQSTSIGPEDQPPTSTYSRSWEFTSLSPAPQSPITYPQPMLDIIRQQTAGRRSGEVRTKADRRLSRTADEKYRGGLSSTSTLAAKRDEYLAIRIEFENLAERVIRIYECAHSFIGMEESRYAT